VRPDVVAIDGPAGSGKSTLARRIADALGLPYVNTGSMYRALTLEALRRGIDVEDAESLRSLARILRFTLSPGAHGELLIDGELPRHELEGPDVEANVSAVARHPRVRDVLRARQRVLGEGGAVMEGRDIGSVVFPDAPVKLYLMADAGERAGRRAEDRRTSAAAGALHVRDQRDARVNPLVPPPDAVVLDTSVLDVEATVRAALDAIRERAPELLP
jgi:cytidylate kinase